MRNKIGWALAIVVVFCLGIGLAVAKSKKSAPPGMVYVPAGEFTMGMDADVALVECRKYYGKACKREWFTNEEPVHKVKLDAFYIDKYEVTQAEYDKCVAAKKCRANEKYDGFTGPKQPVVGVSWNDAKKYCSWAGKRLPTEAEWEKAARGTDGRMYPWGSKFDGKKTNYCDKSCEFDGAHKKWDDGYAKTAPVGSYPSGASPYGALDMAGNVFEWVEDMYKDGYREDSDTGWAHALRGGAWYADIYSLRVPSRRPMTSKKGYDQGTGFRCVQDG